jgi:hypothetical protein
MSTPARARRRLLLAAGLGIGLVFAAGDVAVVMTGRAAQDDALAASYGVYNGEVSAGADRETVTTENDVGLPGGAVNNYYPDTKVDVAVAGTNAEASSADTGPFAQAVVGQQNENQPQYVRASYPGNPNPNGWRAGPATADASAGPASAAAAGTYGAVGTTTTGPVSAPADGSDGLTARSTSYFDSTLGFVTVGDARIHHASYSASVPAGSLPTGAAVSLVLDNVHVNVTVSTRGTGTFDKNISVTVGDASVTVNGMTIPVTIDQNGVTVDQTNAPFDEVQAVSQTLNGELNSAGISVHTVAPQVTQDGADLHVEAEGVVVTVRQIDTLPGVPRQSVRHVLGEVVVDNEAVLAPPPPAVFSPLPSPTDNMATNPGSSTTTVITNVVGSAAAPAPAPASKPAPIAAAPTSVTFKPPHPQWLLFAYLAWQALMIALAGAVYLHRSALRHVP